MSNVGSSHVVVVEEKLVQSQSLRFFEEQIKKLAKPDWDPEELSYSTGVCQYCRARVVVCEKKQKHRYTRQAMIKGYVGKFQIT